MNRCAKHAPQGCGKASRISRCAGPGYWRPRAGREGELEGPCSSAPKVRGAGGDERQREDTTCSPARMESAVMEGAGGRHLRSDQRKYREGLEDSGRQKVDECAEGPWRPDPGE